MGAHVFLLPTVKKKPPNEFIQTEAAPRLGLIQALYGEVTDVAFDIWQEVARGGVTVTAACLAAWLGVKVFLRQKEYDLVKQRYLEGGIDVIAAYQEEALGVFHHNWARCIQLVKMFRDAQESFDLDQLKQGFLELDSSKFHAIPHHRLQILVRTQVFWEVYQLALAFAETANAMVTNEIPETIRLKLTTTKLNADIKRIAEESFKHMKELEDKSHKFSVLTRELEALAGMFQTENFTFKNVLAFNEKAEVKESIERLRREFSNEIKTHDDVAV